MSSRLQLSRVISLTAGLLICSAHVFAASSDGLPAGLSTKDYSSLRAAYDASRHAVFAAGRGYEARNSGQQWTTHFDGRGVTAQPDSGGWTWGLQLESYGFADEVRSVCEPTLVSFQGQRVAYDWDALVQEWWINGLNGLEHGYTVHQRPPRSTVGPLTFTLVVRGDLEPRVQDGGLAIHFTTGGGAAVLTYAGLAVTDADGQALTAWFEGNSTSVKLLIDERGARYPLTVDPTAQQAYLKASNSEASDNFSGSLSISGNTVVIGALNEDSSSTGVNGNESDNSATDSGAAYVFVRSGATWSQQAYLKASNTDAGDNFGWAVSISGDTIVVTAVKESSNATGVNGNQADNSAFASGAAYVFVRSGTTWSQQAYIKASNSSSFDAFGYSAQLDGDTLVVGANHEASNATGVNGDQLDNTAIDAGAAYVFVRSGTAWSQQAYLKASNTEASDAFGSAASVSGNTIVVGSVAEASNATGVNGNQANNSAAGAGAAYVFVRSGTTWTQQAYLKASNTDAGDQYAVSTSVSGDTIVVGANAEASIATGINGNQLDNTTPFVGAAYVYVRTGTSWSQQAYLKASNAGGSFGYLFGFAVSVSGNTLIVGSHGEGSTSTGVNGNQFACCYSGAGAAYVFVRSGTTWSQHDYLKASNTDQNDSFGYSVSVSGNYAVVGAYRESSNATGVNGNQADNSAIFAGAAYTFALDTNFTPFCFGNGTDTACPCTNPGLPGRGCQNTFGSGGASLSSTGMASISSDTLVLNAGNYGAFQFGLYFEGSATANPTAPFAVAFGNGLRCVNFTGANRLEIQQANGAGSSSTTVALSIPGFAVAGTTYYYQLWYRDGVPPTTIGTCVTAGFNFSHAISLAWTP